MRAPRIAATHQECKVVKISAIAMALWFLLVLFANESNKAPPPEAAPTYEMAESDGGLALKISLPDLSSLEEAEVEIVWSPVWNPNMISPEGRTKLGME